MDIPTYIVTGINLKTNRKNTRTIKALDESYATKKMEADGFIEPFEIELAPPAPASARQIDYAVNLGIPIPINATKDEMQRRISAAVDNDVDFSNFNPPSGNGWGAWSVAIHKSPEQVRRQERAKSSQYIPLELSAENQTALFTPSDSSREPYLTTLECCHCLDFYRTAKPCKHMYRLVIELGAILNELKEKYNVESQPSIEKSSVVEKATVKGCFLFVVLILYVFSFIFPPLFVISLPCIVVLVILLIKDRNKHKG